MTYDRTYADYINDILTAIEKVNLFIKNFTFEEFSNDDKTQFAVIRAIEVIGEASKRVPENIKENYPDIPWRKMACQYYPPLSQN